MPVLVGRIRGDASRASEIVIRSVGSDGMETNRDFLSLAEAERLIRSVRRAIGSSRPKTVEVRATDQVCRRIRSRGPMDFDPDQARGRGTGNIDEETP